MTDPYEHVPDDGRWHQDEECDERNAFGSIEGGNRTYLLKHERGGVSLHHGTLGSLPDGAVEIYGGPVGTFESRVLWDTHSREMVTVEIPRGKRETFLEYLQVAHQAQGLPDLEQRYLEEIIAAVKN